MKSQISIQLHIHQAFDRAFTESHNVTLLGGADEPLYTPGTDVTAAQIHYRENYSSSALHEIAHWCVAGKARREQLDYGYWYEAARDQQGQATFESVEVKPQALEWIFHQAVALKFRVSADNLALINHNVAPFQKKVLAAVKGYLVNGLPVRSARFAIELASGSDDYLITSNYKI